MNKIIRDCDKDLTQFKEILIEQLSNYLISKTGIFYNKNTNKYIKPYYHKNTKNYNINLNNSQYQIKHLFYILYINNEYDIDELRNVKSKYTINIKKFNNNLPYINFEVDDLELITKSEKNKNQDRNNRIINQYNCNKEFIKSFDNIEDIRKELDIKYNKYITLACGKLKDKAYRNYYFRYDDNDEIKNPELKLNEINIIGNNEENNIANDLEPEIWKQLQHLEYNSYYNNYEISNHGRFRNYNNKKILKLHKSGNYLYTNINIYNPLDNKKEVKKIRVNILVAEYFIDKPNNINDLVVDHIDGNKLNNYYKNLQYLTHSENIIKG
jgi:hypothetical protein